MRRLIYRDRSTPESRAFWEHAETCARDVATWPDWRKAGVTYEQPGLSPNQQPKEE